MGSEEPKTNEAELWSQLGHSTGAERADVLVDLSHIAYERGDYQEALALCESAKEIYTELGESAYTSRLSHVYDGMMWCNKQLNRKTECAESAQKAAELLVDDEPEKYADALRTAGCFWYNAKEYERSLEFHRRALELPYVEKTEYDSAIDNHNIAMCLQKLDRHEEAVTHFLSSRELSKLAKKPENVASTDYLLAHSFIELEIAVEAEFFAQKSLDYAELTNSKSDEAWSLYALGSARVLMDQLDDALTFFTRARDIAVNLAGRDWSLIIQLEHEIADIVEAQGNEDQANRIRARIATIEETMGED